MIGWRVTQAWRKVLLQDPCVYCGGKAEGLDHITPRSFGGLDGWENRAPACHACDRLKGGYTMLSYIFARQFATGRMKARAYRYLDDGTRRSAWSATLRTSLKRFGFVHRGNKWYQWSLLRYHDSGLGMLPEEGDRAELPSSAGVDHS